MEKKTLKTILKTRQNSSLGALEIPGYL